MTCCGVRLMTGAYRRQVAAKTGYLTNHNARPKTVRSAGIRTKLASNSVDVVPSLCTIEFPNLNSVDLLRLKVARVDADCCARSGTNRLPMCRAATNLTMHRANRTGSPEVLIRILRMPGELDGVGFV